MADLPFIAPLRAFFGVRVLAHAFASGACPALGWAKRNPPLFILPHGKTQVPQVTDACCEITLPHIQAIFGGAFFNILQILLSKPDAQRQCAPHRSGLGRPAATADHSLIRIRLHSGDQPKPKGTGLVT